MPIFEDANVIRTVKPLTGSPYVTITTVGATALLIVPQSLSARKYVLMQADEANTADLYFGGPAVTADAGVRGGIQIHPGGFLELNLGELATLYVISTAASQKLRVLESA